MNELPWVLVDLSFLAHWALHSVGELSHEEVPTGILFGVFSQLRQLCQDDRVLSNRVAFLCDSYQSVRKKAYPAYKEKRRKEREPHEEELQGLLWGQIKLLRKRILPDCGFPVLTLEGFESDDIMAAIAKQLSLQGAFGAKKPRGILVTADGDLFQCISPSVHWFDPMRRLYYTPDSFQTAKGIHPGLWGEVKALAGCSTDNVAGIPGVGEKTAIQYLLGQSNPKHKKTQAILSPEGRAVVERNRTLVVLPHPKLPAVQIPSDPEYSPEQFFGYCKRYGLEMFRRDREGWERFFRGPPRFVPRRRGESKGSRRIIRIRKQPGEA